MPKASKAEILLKTANEYMRNMYSMFGGKSTEYMNALSQYRALLPDKQLTDTARKGLNYNGDTPNEPLLLSTGKKSIAEWNKYIKELEKLRQAQRKSGTALVQAQKYIKNKQLTQEELEKEIKKNKKWIRVQAEENYNLSNNLNTWYNEIMNSPIITDNEKAKVRRYYSEVNAKYYDTDYMNDLKEYVEQIYNKAKQYAEQKQSDEENANFMNGGQSVNADILS